MKIQKTRYAGVNADVIYSTICHTTHNDRVCLQVVAKLALTVWKWRGAAEDVSDDVIWDNLAQNTTQWQHVLNCSLDDVIDIEISPPSVIKITTSNQKTLEYLCTTATSASELNYLIPRLKLCGTQLWNLHDGLRGTEDFLKLDTVRRCGLTDIAYLATTVKFLIEAIYNGDDVTEANISNIGIVDFIRLFLPMMTSYLKNDVITLSQLRMMTSAAALYIESWIAAMQAVKHDWNPYGTQYSSTTHRSNFDTNLANAKHDSNIKNTIYEGVVGANDDVTIMCHTKSHIQSRGTSAPSKTQAFTFVNGHVLKMSEISPNIDPVTQIPALQYLTAAFHNLAFFITAIFGSKQDIVLIAVWVGY